MDLGLHGLKAFVAGSSRGLGYATALRLAQEGCIVTVNARNVERAVSAAQKLAAETGATVYGLAGDVGDPSAATHLITEAARLMGGLDILFTNAGGPPPGKFEFHDDTVWENAVNQSFLSHVRLIRAALPYLRRSSRASILTCTSYSVKQPIANLILSNSVRMSVIGLTKSLAFELGREGIRVNSILPGWTMTERVGVLMENRAVTNHTSIDEEISKQAADTALGRLAQPEEFANVAAFIVSPAASYLTGVMISVDGGAYKGTF